MFTTIDSKLWNRYSEIYQKQITILKVGIEYFRLYQQPYVQEQNLTEVKVNQFSVAFELPAKKKICDY